MTTSTAVILGVGPLDGLGGALCERAAQGGLHVVAAGRTPDALDAVTLAIKNNGGQASTFVTDATQETDVNALIAHCESIGPLELCIYNAGNNFPGSFLQMEADYFERAWRVGCFGGFLFARAALRTMTPRATGTLLFTGASASLRGKPGFAAFTAAKAGLRTMVQSLAKEYGAQGIHVAQVMIDGGINGARLRERLGDQPVENPDAFVGLSGLADLYLFLHHQPRNAWTHELDVRTHLENF